MSTAMDCSNTKINNSGIEKLPRKSKLNFLSWLLAVLFTCGVSGQSPDRPPCEGDQDKSIKVDGEPFFPIGLWLFQTHVDDTLLKNASEAGFNTIVAKSTRPLWDRAAFHDLKVIGWLQPLYGPLDPEAKQQFEQDVSDWLEQFSDHPSLLAWFLADEPVWRELSFERILQSYQTHRKLDPERPIWINYAPRNTVEALSEWMQACDITGADIYPVPEGGGHSEKDDKIASAVGKYIS